MWKKPLEDMLDELRVSPEKKFKYFSKPRLEYLKFNLMDYFEDVLLIRDEYLAAYNTLEKWFSSGVTGGGVVVTGQPGIGAP